MTELATLLDAVDPHKIRSSTARMRAAVHQIALEVDDPGWTGTLDALLADLSAVAQVDLCLARLVEGHADALRILRQAESTPANGVYGVWASRSAGTGLLATHKPGGWRLSGQVRFASGVDLIDRALVPGWVDGAHHLLFDLPVAGLDADRDSWSTGAMDASRSFTVTVDIEASEAPVGAIDFYLDRPGFVVGGLGPAAVWCGGARLVCDLVADGLDQFTPSSHQLRRLGVMEQAAWTAETMLGQASQLIADRTAGQVARQASRLRTTAVTAADVAVTEAPLIVGPAGLSGNQRLARAVADLGIYIRQHHLDAELARLGERALVDRTELPR